MIGSRWCLVILLALMVARTEAAERPTPQNVRFDAHLNAQVPLDLHFRDQAGRDHMKKYDGIEAGFENVANYLRSLVDQKAPAAG